MANLFDLSGKVAIITGGSRGLGLEMGKAFALAGANVVVASRKAEACIEAAREMQDLSGNECIGIGCHVGQWDAVTNLTRQVLDRFGRVDVLVNNAGMSPLYPSLTEVSEELFDKVVGVNMKGPFRLAALIGEAMVKGEGGSIINVSSTSSVQPSPVEMPYGMAKAGLNAMTLSLARAYAPKVRVNCIMPGPFLTDISKAWDMEAFKERAKNNIPLARGGEPDEIVGAALYFASDASSYTTGAILKVDGGSAWTPG
ncbi:MAG: SDR family oxidoreductase [Gammaproteobacteria bacterium]|nr:SDR family oxidoreductase [Gammaproteobacteria bacterium]